MLAVLILETIGGLTRGADDSREPLPLDAFMPFRNRNQQDEAIEQAREGLESLRGLG